MPELNVNDFFIDKCTDTCITNNVFIYSCIRFLLITQNFSNINFSDKSNRRLGH